MKAYEEWIQIPEYPDYFVSNFGRVKVVKSRKAFDGSSVIKEKVFTSMRMKSGYFVVRLTLNKKKKSLYLHRLVAKAFVPNQENKPFVNHIDGNKLNNHFTNLEWSTQQENTQHSWDNGLQQSCLVWTIKYPECSEEWFTSLKLASEATGVPIDEITTSKANRKNSSNYDFKVFKK